MGGGGGERKINTNCSGPCILGPTVLTDNTKVHVVTSGGSSYVENLVSPAAIDMFAPMPVLVR